MPRLTSSTRHNISVPGACTADFPVVTEMLTNSIPLSIRVKAVIAAGLKGLKY